jgi:hypothetical protein
MKDGLNDPAEAADGATIPCRGHRGVLDVVEWRDPSGTETGLGGETSEERGQQGVEI